MAKIELSSLENHIKLTRDSTDVKNNLKLDINIKNLKKERLSIKNLKKDVCCWIIIINIFFLLMFSIINVRVICQMKNTIQRHRILEDEAHRYIYEKVKKLEIRINNIFRLKYNNQFTYNTQPWNLESTNVSKIKNDQNSNSALVIFDKDNSTVLSTFVQPVDRQDNAVERNSRILNGISQISEIEESEMIDERFNLSRQKRAVEAQNHTTTEDERNGNNTVDVQRESRVKRLPKQVEDVGRGKKRRGNRRRPKRSRRRLDPAVVTFIGAIPEQEFTKDASIKDADIGPWIKSNKDSGSYDFTKFYLTEENYSIEVTVSGLYMISVQIFYFGKSINHSYWVLLNSEGTSMKRKLITCAIASVTSSEASCYTGVTVYLQKGDRLSIQQQEKNRFINLREGYSQVQLVLLVNDKLRRRPYNKEL